MSRAGQPKPALLLVVAVCVIAALGPIAFGALHTATGDGTVPLLLLVLVLLGQGVIGALVGRERFVLQRR